jgi:hypothetical protein
MNIKIKHIIAFTVLSLTFIAIIYGQDKKAYSSSKLMGNRFLTFNTIIRVNQIEVSRNRNVGEDEHT